ncbi:MAG: phosphomethylpyrimidine synthase ThiC, partial [Plesiomonas sp.]
MSSTSSLDSSRTVVIVSSAESSDQAQQAPTRQASRAAAKTFLDTLQAYPYPNSHKVYLQGSRPDIRVGMREITLAPSLVGGSKNSPIYQDNQPVRVYDSSGNY